MKDKKFLFFILVVVVAGAVIVVAAHHTAEQQQMMSMGPGRNSWRGNMMPMHPPAAPSITVTTQTPAEIQVITRNLEVTAQVTDVQKTVNQISDLVKNNQGYVIGDQIFQQQYFTQTNGNPSYSGNSGAELSIRVPAANTENILNQLDKVGTVTTQSDSLTDSATIQTRLQTQLKNLQAAQTQLESLMKAAKTVDDTLSTEQALNRVELQIAALTEQLQSLSSNETWTNLQLKVTASAPNAGGSVMNPSQFGGPRMMMMNQVSGRPRLFAILAAGAFVIFLPILIIAVIAWAVWQRSHRKA